ncbi:MAG: chloride channel protein [Sorangiineae bacterium]|nr:chloride channel protein [Polyangiaceae bacterium]MEB2324259.1 chloride channel protein [Sorangiineae bacterium]
MIRARLGAPLLARFGRIPFRDPNTRFVGLAALVGLLGAAGATVFRWLTAHITALLTGSPDIVEGAARLPPAWRVAIPAVGGLVGGLIARRFVRTGGTMGIAQIMEVVAVGRRTVRFRQSLARTASSLAVISTGGSEGREGPIIQMAAAFAAWVGRASHVSPARAQILVACGMAAGVAGAYNTPIAATLFVVELVVGSFSMAVFGPVVVASVVSSVVTRALLGNEPLYRVAPFELRSGWELVPYIPLGLLGGMGAVGFTRALRLAKRAFRATGLRDEYRMALAGAGVGALGLVLPEVWGNGFEGTNRILGAELPLTMLGVLLLGKLAATGLTIGSGGVGGVFTPGLMVGATLGAILGTLVERVFPQLSAPVYCYALLGMGALLAGTTRAPVLAIIMMFELTDTPQILLPMMIVSVLAITGAKVFERESIYVEELRDAGVEWEGTTQETMLASVRARDIMRTHVALIPETLDIARVIERFMADKSLYLYVGDAEGRLVGVIDLHDIKENLTNPGLTPLVIARDVAQDIPTVAPDESVSSINEKLWFRDYGQLPVIDSPVSRRFLGIVTRRDILGAIDREVLQRSALFAEVKRVPSAEPGPSYLELPEKHRLVELRLPATLVGKRLAESGLRAAGALVLVLKRATAAGNEQAILPAPDEVLRADDRLVVLATDEALARWAGAPESTQGQRSDSGSGSG